MVDNLRFIGKRAIQKRVTFWRLPKPGVTGFHPASRTEQMVAEIGPVALLQRRRSFDRICIVFLHNLQTLRFVSLLEPRHIVIHSLICSTLGANLGTRLIPKNQATVEIGHGWVLLIVVPSFKFLHIALTCEVEAPRCVRIRLNWLKASHRKPVRLRVHHAQVG